MAAECIRLKNLIKGWDAHLYTLSLSLSSMVEREMAPRYMHSILHLG